MGIEGENDWVCLGNECCEGITKRQHSIWEAKRISLEREDPAKQKGVFESVLGCSLYHHWVRSPYYLVGLEHRLAGSCWKPRTWY